MFSLFTTTIITFLVLDTAWLFFASSFFKGEIGQIARVSADGSWNILYLPAAVVYILMTLGLVFFILPKCQGLLDAFVFGAIFGLIVYGVYDMTNLATISAWTTKFALVDIIWGSVLFSATSTFIYWLFY